jgi:hypothetical protein
MYRIKNSEGNWVTGVPTNGQPYRMVMNGSYAESIWADVVAATKITQLAFLNRFFDEEAVDIDLASMGATREAALLRRYLQKVSAATFIDLARPDLSEDLQKLVAFNIMTQERVDYILSAPIQEHELYKGN